MRPTRAAVTGRFRRVGSGLACPAGVDVRDVELDVARPTRAGIVWRIGTSKGVGTSGGARRSRSCSDGSSRRGMRCHHRRMRRPGARRRQPEPGWDAAGGRRARRDADDVRGRFGVRRVPRCISVPEPAQVGEVTRQPIRLRLRPHVPGNLRGRGRRAGSVDLGEFASRVGRRGFALEAGATTRIDWERVSRPRRHGPSTARTNPAAARRRHSRRIPAR